MNPDYQYKGALSRAGYEHITVMLPKMNAAGLRWLTPVIAGMTGGDPWQEGLCALEIVEAWEKTQ